jgi:pyridoxal phosphate enzyme (YggS family)
MSTVIDGQETKPAEDALLARYRSVCAKIEAAAVKSKRRASDIVLVAVTKYATIEQIRQLVQLGHVDLGESRAQVLTQHAAQIEDFLARRRELRLPGAPAVPRAVRWHMIGHMQRNKVRKVLEIVRLTHSVDSLRLAEEIQPIAETRLKEPAEVLIQVNVTGEKQKFGVAPVAARHLIDQVDTMYNVRVRGIMCMSVATDDPETTRPSFERAKELFDEIRGQRSMPNDHFNILSMGMSQDYEVAIECGANVVRVGSAIFGRRETIV